MQAIAQEKERKQKEEQRRREEEKRRQAEERRRQDEERKKAEDLRRRAVSPPRHKQNGLPRSESPGMTFSLYLYFIDTLAMFYAFIRAVETALLILLMSQTCAFSVPQHFSLLAISQVNDWTYGHEIWHNDEYWWSVGPV